VTGRAPSVAFPPRAAPPVRQSCPETNLGQSLTARRGATHATARRHARRANTMADAAPNAGARWEPEEDERLYDAVVRDNLARRVLSRWTRRSTRSFCMHGMRRIMN